MKKVFCVLAFMLFGLFIISSSSVEISFAQEDSIDAAEAGVKDRWKDPNPVIGNGCTNKKGEGCRFGSKPMMGDN